MKIILSDKELNSTDFSHDVIIKKITHTSMEKYNHNVDVIAVVGSRAMAVKCAEMDMPGMKLFQLTSAGIDGVPCEKYASKNIAVSNAGGVYSVPIAETVVFGILIVAKKLRQNPNNRHFKIQRHYSTITELMGKNILIMGAGNIGTAIADRLLGFEVHIDGYDPYCAEKEQYQHMIRTRKELIQIIGKYDYIISTLPDNIQTNKFIDAEIFDHMKNSVVVINVGRKAVFNEEDFYTALKNRRIGGAVLDMFEKVPNPIQNKFRRLSNVVVFPGVAAISQEVNERLRVHITKNLLDALNGNKISNVINGVE